MLMFAVVEDMKYRQNILCQISRLLEPDGNLPVTTPSQFSTGIHRSGAKAGLFSNNEADEPETLFSLATLQSLLNKNGQKGDSICKFLWDCHQLFKYSGKIR